SCPSSSRPGSPGACHPQRDLWRNAATGAYRNDITCRAASSEESPSKEYPMNDEQNSGPLNGTATTPDTADQPDNPGRDYLKLEREPLDLGDTGRSTPRGARAFLWLTILVAVAVAAGVLLKAWGRDTEKANTTGLEADQS